MTAFLCVRFKEEDDEQVEVEVEVEEEEVKDEKPKLPLLGLLL